MDERRPEFVSDTFQAGFDAYPVEQVIARVNGSSREHQQGTGCRDERGLIATFSEHRKTEIPWHYTNTQPSELATSTETPIQQSLWK